MSSTLATFIGIVGIISTLVGIYISVKGSRRSDFDSLINSMKTINEETRSNYDSLKKSYDVLWEAVESHRKQIEQFELLQEQWYEQKEKLEKELGSLRELYATVSKQLVTKETQIKQLELEKRVDAGVIRQLRDEIQGLKVRMNNYDNGEKNGSEMANANPQ